MHLLLLQYIMIVIILDSVHSEECTDFTFFFSKTPFSVIEMLRSLK